MSSSATSSLRHNGSSSSNNTNNNNNNNNNNNSTVASPSPGGGVAADRIEWSRSTILEFIDDYRQQRVLWDPNTKGYHIKQTKYEALKALGGRYGTEIRSIRSKIKSLRSSFHREHGKVMSAATKGFHYQPMWFAYEAIRFILDGEAATVASAMGAKADTPKSDTATATAMTTVAQQLKQQQRQLLLLNGCGDGDGDGDIGAETIEKKLSAIDGRRRHVDGGGGSGCGGGGVDTGELRQRSPPAPPPLSSFLYRGAALAAAPLSPCGATAAKVETTTEADGDAYADDAHVDTNDVNATAARAVSASVAGGVDGGTIAATPATTATTPAQVAALSTILTTASVSASAANDHSIVERVAAYAAAVVAAASLDAVALQGRGEGVGAVGGGSVAGNAADEFAVSAAAAAAAAAAGVPPRSDSNCSGSNYGNIRAEDVKTEIFESDAANDLDMERQQQNRQFDSSPSSSSNYKPFDQLQQQQQQQQQTHNRKRKAQDNAHDICALLTRQEQLHQQMMREQQRPLQHSTMISIPQAQLAFSSESSDDVRRASARFTATCTATSSSADVADRPAGDTTAPNGARATHASQQPSKSTADHCDEYGVFGEYVGLTIRKLKTPNAQIVVKHLINNMLYEAELGKYDHGMPASKQPPQLYRM